MSGGARKRVARGANETDEGAASSSSSSKRNPSSDPPPTIVERLWDFLSIVVTRTIQLIVALCLFGFLLNLGLSAKERATLEHLGTTVEVVASSPLATAPIHLSVFCQGPATSDPVLFMVPSTSMVAELGLLHHLAAKTGLRVCTYDRPARMWSTGRINATDAAVNVEQLHQVLQSGTGVKDAQVVLIGHSMGAQLAAAYSMEHPKGVKGLVLLDSMATSHTEDVVAEIKRGSNILHIFSTIGVLRLISLFKAELLPHYECTPEEYRSLLVYCVNQPGHFNDEIDLEKPLSYLIANHTKAFNKLNIPVLNIRSSVFSKESWASDMNELWEEAWSKEEVLTGALTTKKVSTVTIPESTHSFCGFEDQVVQHIQKYISI